MEPFGGVSRAPRPHTSPRLPLLPGPSRGYRRRHCILRSEMPSTIGHKRQRADLDDDTIALSTIARDATDIRNSLRSLHKALPQLGDITVSVQLSGEHEAHNFPCISALLASASRPLAAMLFGPMADASGGLSRPRDQRILRLSGTEPWCFEQMLSFIHGHHLCAPPGSYSCNPSLPQPLALFLSATVY